MEEKKQKFYSIVGQITRTIKSFPGSDTRMIVVPKKSEEEVRSKGMILILKEYISTLKRGYNEEITLDEDNIYAVEYLNLPFNYNAEEGDISDPIEKD